MEFKLGGLKGDQTGDELIGQMLADILTGLKSKMIQPVLEENYKIAGQLKALIASEQAEMAEIKEKLAALDTQIQQIPLVILSSFRDAINQAGGDAKHDKD